eukprot:403464-Hanusia_phi.AAC.4
MAGLTDSTQVDADMLLRIVKLIHPEASQESSKNKEALAVLRSELSDRSRSGAGDSREKKAKGDDTLVSVVALFLPLLSSDGQGDLQQTSRELLMVFLRHDAEGVTMRELVKHHQGWGKEKFSIFDVSQASQRYSPPSSRHPPRHREDAGANSFGRETTLTTGELLTLTCFRA